jgi:hypothetical protein
MELEFMKYGVIEYSIHTGNGSMKFEATEFSTSTENGYMRFGEIGFLTETGNGWGRIIEEGRIITEILAVLTVGVIAFPTTSPALTSKEADRGSRTHYVRNVE